MTLTELKKRLDKLSPTGIRFVARMVESLSSPPQAQVKEPGTWLTPEWIEYFGLALSVHHGTTTEPLAQKAFETVFQNACESVGWKVDKPESETWRFLDLVLQRNNGAEHKLSLKSTAQKRLSAKTVHISKLTEAAWVQDMRTARDRREQTVNLFQQYVDAVDSIMMLRAFRRPKQRQTTPSKYQLIEIPTETFRSLFKSPLHAFNADGPTIDCSYGGFDMAARVSLDRSDAKITIKAIQIAACTEHVTWEIEQR